MFYGTRPLPTLDVLGQRLLDVLELLPSNITLVCPGKQRKPLLRTLAAPGSTWLSIRIRHGCCRLAVGVGASIDRIGQDTPDTGIDGPFPHDAAVGPACRELQAFFEEPQKRLPYRAQFAKLPEDQEDGFLDTLIGVFLETLVLGLQKAYRCHHH